jgi:hypothetical protein
MLQDRRALFAGVAFDEHTVIGGGDGSGSSDGDVPFVIYMSGSLVPYPSSSHFHHRTVAALAADIGDLQVLGAEVCCFCPSRIASSWFILLEA